MSLLKVSNLLTLAAFLGLLASLAGLWIATGFAFFAARFSATGPRWPPRANAAGTAAPRSGFVSVRAAIAENDRSGYHADLNR